LSPAATVSRAKADLSLALCSFFWGATFVVVKGVLSYASVFLFLALRFTLAAALMAMFQPRLVRKVKRAELLAGAALGFFMLSGYCFQTAGLLYTTPAKSGLVTGSSVVLVPLLLALFWRKQLTLWAYGGAMAAFLGLYYLTVPPEGIRHLNIGDLLTFIAATFYAFHIILVGRYTKLHSVVALSVLQVAVCAVLAWIATAGSNAFGLERVRFVNRWELYAGVAVCAVFATAVAFTIQLWAQRFTSPSHAAILFTLEPVFAALTSYLLIHERFGRRAGIGAALVLAGILLAELKGPAPAAPESPEPTGEMA